MQAPKQMISSHTDISISIGHWTPVEMRYLNKTSFLTAEVMKIIDLTNNTIQNLFFQQIKNITLSAENQIQQFPGLI